MDRRFRQGLVLTVLTVYLIGWVAMPFSHGAFHMRLAYWDTDGRVVEHPADVSFVDDVGQDLYCPFCDQHLVALTFDAPRTGTTVPAQCLRVQPPATTPASPVLDLSTRGPPLLA